MNPPAFLSRWLIIGRLTTRSELHIGDGGSLPLVERLGSKSDALPEYATVCTDARQCAYVPGSAIKGILRSLTDGFPPDLVDGLLGSAVTNSPTSVGGKLEFWDAFHRTGIGTTAEQPSATALHGTQDLRRPWWDAKRRTAITTSVSIDRRTRTASEGLLYTTEYVPPGEVFEVEISGDNLDPREVERTLQLLSRLNDSEVSLGGNASSGWGRVEWQLTEVRCFGQAELKEWLKSADLAGGLEATRTLGRSCLAEIRQSAQSLASLQRTQPMMIEITVTSDTPWLARDARQRERCEAATAASQAQPAKPANAVAIRDENGNPFYPAKSLRGILRTHAERILRTLALPCATNPTELPAAARRDPLPVSPPLAMEGKARGTKTDAAGASPMTEGRAARSGKELDSLDLVAKLFGCAAWHSPLQVSRLESPHHPGSPPTFHQEFVAIDRFTGGAAEGAKFDAELARGTTLRGKLAIDVDRLKRLDPELTSLGLLSLVLRDFTEGDIPIGSGSSKGLGHCLATAKIDDNPWHTHQFLRDGLANLRKLL